MSLKSNKLENRLELKKEVFSKYGGACVCCKENCLAFLTLDHVDNNGKDHRKRLGKNRTSYRFYLWLKENNYPKFPRLQVLCWNCNMAKARFGQCPHKLFREYMRSHKITYKWGRKVV